ncbi:MAG: phosphodiester glycosidase family protein [Ilumatobacteraceae bacterium]
MPPTTTAAAAARPAAPLPAARRRPRRIARRILAGLLSVLTLAGCSAYWALDRYVIDHVQIADVAAYEEQVTGTTTPTAATDDGDGDTASAAATVTATSYESDTVSIEISTVVTGSGDDQVTTYVADVQLADVTQLRGGFADNQFGTNIVDETSDIAAAYDAIFAVNGDYYGYRDTGIVIRNGVLYRDEGARTGLAIYRDGTFEVYDETTTTGAALLAAGVWNTISFGPALLEDGQIVAGIDDVEVDTNFGNHSIQGRQPRTAIGIVEPGHYVFVVVDGRSTGYSRGVTMTELAGILQQLGATVAYNLDGGGSSTMYFNGQLVNDPLGRDAERETSDIFYVA